mmetsp:Transcript_41150/g.88413  ORF Transcript_41150/g.88413 Transcript_41150/m.88413 type:complete len:401 (+) Transcript_41150:152-1354(+)|eukprot:CAMPEP_0206450144 /NCGR_PEP_ID=MMETSP0324_2-20121206/18533_1 /ASSEMBLY_ACC=CAM_ASM_000836 /TAXON_ID=2866 /ORGANISM="Crypthecodinium cohnii, Strain Seligo" /LENGTH=400 /DNA_ID=CAMNT_0053919703 /DNA_START=152 /DNA_END=1354 /DNA_ORIENTATION=+
MAANRVQTIANQVVAAPTAATSRSSSASSTTSDIGPLVTLEHGAGGVAELKLCRPKKLNSLNIPMIHDLKKYYAELAEKRTKCVFLKGEGRALCAGGDVQEVQEGIYAGTTLPADFFWEEYTLDYDIATLYRRTGAVQVAFWDGIVMGGGVGLSAHSPIIIATEKTVFAMPETGIALFPDVGMTYKLSRLPAGEHVGIFLGITGQRLSAADCLAAGLATHYCPSDKLPEVEKQIRALGDKVGDVEAISAIIKSVAGSAKADDSKAIITQHSETLKKCFGSAKSVEEIVANLNKDGSDFAKSVIATLKTRSPMSVKVTFEAIQRHKSVTFKEAFIMEYRISQWCMRKQPEADFCEGIRAVLVDKDQKPNWIPNTFEAVSQAKVNEFFAPLPKSHPRGELPL